MIKTILVTALIMAISVTSSTAGTITKSAWAPNECGTEPVVPVIDTRDEVAYNASIKAINEWQQLTNTFNTCLVNEANADNALIAKSANDIQGRFKATVEKIKSEIEAGKARLEKQ